MKQKILAILILAAASSNVGSAPESHSETPRAVAVGGDFTLTRDVIASGGALASGGSFSAVTTTGQGIVGVQSGGGLRLTGGFHLPVGSSDQLFRDRFEH